MKAVTQSRNKREGRFIPGWCLNPWAVGKSDEFPPVRAGGDNGVTTVNHGYCGKVFVILWRR